MSVPRVLLADDHLLLLELLKNLLESNFEVVGAVTDGRALLSAARNLKPDVVVLDIAMPKVDGLDAGRYLKRMFPQLKLIYLTMNEDPDVESEAFRLGASGYILKSSAAAELTGAIKEALGEKSPKTYRTRAALMKDQRTAPGGKLNRVQLTSRQQEVLRLLAMGNSLKETAAVLHLAPRTVAFHKYRIMEQLEIETSAGLVLYAAKHGILNV